MHIINADINGPIIYYIIHINFVINNICLYLALTIIKAWFDWTGNE